MSCARLAQSWAARWSTTWEVGAIWHILSGDGTREGIGRGTSIVPSTKTVDPMATRIDVPLTHLGWSYAGSHSDAVEIGVSDSPRPNEVVFDEASAMNV